MAKAKSAFPMDTTRSRRSSTLDNAAQAIEWYRKALGAEEIARAVGAGRQDHARRDAHRRFADHGERRDDGRQETELAGRIAGVALDLRRGLRRAVQPCRGGGRASLPGPMGAMADQFWGDRAAPSSIRMDTSGRSRRTRKT